MNGSYGAAAGKRFLPFFFFISARSCSIAGEGKKLERVNFSSVSLRLSNAGADREEMDTLFVCVIMHSWPFHEEKKIRAYTVAKHNAYDMRNAVDSSV